jgi:hypothetical protein
MPRPHFPPALAIALVIAIVFPLATTADAQNPRFAPYPEQRFPALAKDAINTYFDSEDAYKAGNYKRAKGLLSAFWKKHPPGTAVWGSDLGGFPGSIGANFGDPPCYYALLMLSECIEWRLSKKAATGKAHPLNWTVVLVGKSAGVEPRDQQELANGGGVMAEHTLDPRLEADDFRVMRESMWLFLEYVSAMTSGDLAAKVEFVTLPQHTIPVNASSNGINVAQPTEQGLSAVFDEIPAATRRNTDWWLVIHPSHVPDKYPPFSKTAFVTGGMGFGPDGGSPCFLADDKSFVRKPPHLGTGDYTDHERRAYLPQWFQHEFYHHLFRTYPDMKLEVKSHQWFDRKMWPADFVGLREPDYYHQALHKRFRKGAVKPQMAVALRYAAPPADVLERLDAAGIVGEYVRPAPDNEYHRGTISMAKDTDGRNVFRWTNAAGVSWRLEPELYNGALVTGPDNPYFKNGSRGRQFTLVLPLDAEGNFLPEVHSFRFNGDEYVRQPRK